MNKQEFLAEHRKLLDQLHEITIAKNQDYSGDADPFANFREVEIGGICSVEIGMLTRMSDKWSRMKKLILSGKDPQVIDESVNDTLLDYANYCLIMVLWRMAKK